MFCITRVRELKREREREVVGEEKSSKETIYIYICYKSRAKRKWREKKGRERVTGAKISDLDHTHGRKKKEDGGKGAKYFTIELEIEDESERFYKIRRSEFDN